MQLNELTLKQLKQLAQVWHVKPSGDKRKKTTWVQALEVKRQELAHRDQNKSALSVLAALAPAHNNYIPIYEWRSRMRHLTRTEQDQELYRLQREDKIELSTLQEVRHYTKAQINQGIPQPIGGSLFFIMLAA